MIFSLIVHTRAPQGISITRHATVLVIVRTTPLNTHLHGVSCYLGVKIIGNVTACLPPTTQCESLYLWWYRGTVYVGMYVLIDCGACNSAVSSSVCSDIPAWAKRQGLVTKHFKWSAHNRHTESDMVRLRQLACSSWHGGTAVVLPCMFPEARYVYQPEPSEQRCVPNSTTRPVARCSTASPPAWVQWFATFPGLTLLHNNEARILNRLIHEPTSSLSVACEG